MFSTDVEGDVIDPCLKNHCRMLSLQIEWLVEDQFCNGRSLRAALEDPFAAVLWICCNPLCLDDAWPPGKVNGQF